MAFVGNVQLVRGDAETAQFVLSILEQEGISVHGNPDLYIRNYGQFGVDDARDIRERASTRALGERRIFVITMAGITGEAQNALLKTLEDAPGNSLFFFIVPSPETLLPTVRSRSQELHLDAKAAESAVDPAAFLAATPAQRIALLEPLLEKGEDDKRDLGAVLTFLSSLERILGGGARAESEGAESARREGLESVYRARRYLADRGALVKPLLEQVALLVPRRV